MQTERDLTVKEFSIKDLLGKVPDISLANVLGVSRERVRQYRVKLGIKKPISRQRAELPESIKGMLRTIPIPQLSKKLGMSTTLLYYYRKGFGIDPVPVRVIDWVGIKRDLDGGMTNRALAAKYGVSEVTLSRGLLRKFGFRRWQQKKSSWKLKKGRRAA